MTPRQRFPNWKAPEITHGVPTAYGWTVFKPENLKLGDRVDIGLHTGIFAGYGVDIGDSVQIAGNCLLYTSSTIDQELGHDGWSGPITIGARAKIGAQVTIFPNVTIGARSIITPHSSVKAGTIVPPDQIWGGVSAKFKRDLTDDEKARSTA